MQEYEAKGEDDALPEEEQEEFANVADSDSDEPRFRCDVCGSYVRTERALKLHHSRKHVQPTGEYLCSICSKMFSNKHTFRMHELRHTPGGGPFKCEECDKGYTSKTLLESHMAKHTGRYRHGYLLYGYIGFLGNIVYRLITVVKDCGESCKIRHSFIHNFKSSSHHLHSVDVANH